MTDEEKVLLLVGGSEPIVMDGIPTGRTTIVPGAAGTTRPIGRFGIPATVLADGPAGLRIRPKRDGDDATYYATGFPVGTLVASSWDVDLMAEMTAAMGNEALEYGVDVLLAPGANIHRNPLCGRNFEYFSEDPLLSGKMAAAFIRGIQGNGVGTSLKHFAANNQETNRQENDAIIGHRALREIYLRNFEIAVKEGRPWTVMSSYNKINGEYTQQSHDLLTKILRNEWGFDGIVMTDWGNKANTVKAVKAGNDLMEPGSKSEVDRILQAVRSGVITGEELDGNVRHILEYIVKTPTFAGYVPSNSPDLKAHAEVARKAAGESIVLLRNEDGTLPLRGDESVALYGVTSIDFIAGGTGAGNVNKAYVVTMEEALENAGFQLDSVIKSYNRAYVDYFRSGLELDPARKSKVHLGAVKIPDTDFPSSAIGDEAKTNDAAVIVLGRNAGEGADRGIEDDFELTSAERDLIRNVGVAFHAEGKKVIVVLNVGGVVETASWKDLVDAIVLPWSPGQEGANAVVDVLTGRVNPSGKLPMTFPVSIWDNPSTRNFPYGCDGAASAGREPIRNVDRTEYEEGIYVGYRYFTTFSKEVSYPFGHGLSYTDFDYLNPKVKARKDGGFTAAVEVRNTGGVAGKEVVELYVAAPSGGLDKPTVELKAFAKTDLLGPGESETVTMTVDDYSLASYNEASGAWEAAAGSYRVYFSSDVNTPLAEGRYKLKTPLAWKVTSIGTDRDRNDITACDDFSASLPDALDSGPVHVYVTTADGSRLFSESSEGFSTVPATSLNMVNLDRNRVYQTVDGFGAAITGATCFNLMQMSQTDRTAFLTDIFDRSSGMGSCLVRVSIGASDFPASGKEFTWCDTVGIENFAPHEDDLDYLIPVLKEIYAINPDVRIIAAPWSAPLWMKESGAWSGSSLKEECYDDYALYFVKWIQYMESMGFDIYAVTPQNEPLYEGNSMAMFMSWEQERDFIKYALGPAFRAAGIKTKILVLDHSYDYEDIADQADYPLLIYSDPDASRFVAGSAWHNYRGDVSTLDQINHEFPDKEIYFTEASIGEWSYDFAKTLISDFSDIFIGTLSRMGRGVTLWNLMLDDHKGPHSPAKGACRTCFGAVDISSSDYSTITYRTHYYQLAHVSKVIKRGAVRIGASGDIPEGVSCLAFENPDGSIGVIVLNEGTDSRRLAFAEGEYSVNCDMPGRSIVSLLWKYGD